MISLKLLKKAADEFNSVMRLDPPIDTSIPAADLINEIKDSIKYVDPVQDVFSDDVQSVINELVEEAVEPEEGNDGDAETLEDQIMNAERIGELREIAKADAVFKSMRGQLASFKTIDDLRDAMMEALQREAPEEEGVEPTAGYVDQDNEEDEDTDEPVHQTDRPAKTGRKEVPIPVAKEKKPTRVSSVVQYERSSVNKAIVKGTKVRFTTAGNSTVAPSEVLIGEVLEIKTDVKKTPNEVLKIQTRKGVFHKATKSVEIAK